jgi:VIT1/CCC1 family predicted Fe2+/Mn2+ transporter
MTEEKREPATLVGKAAQRAGWAHRHRDVSGGWLRPTVFGAVDGLVTAEVSLERRMLDRFPAAEQEELAGYFRGYGADSETAARMAAAVSRDPDMALQVHSRQELGVDPKDLPSPSLAAVSSLFSFSAGAVVPLLPYLAGATTLWASLALSAVALLAGGMAVGRLTGRPLLGAGLRQLAFGAVAIAVTYLVGLVIGGHGA